jgi:TolB protein
MLYQLLVKTKRRKQTIQPQWVVQEERPLVEDRRYRAALAAIQHGAWSSALPLLGALRTDYPTAPELATLFDEALLKAEVESTWKGRVKGQAGGWVSGRVVRLLVYVLLLAAMLAAGARAISHSRQTSAWAHAQRVQLEQAQAAFAAGHYREAVDGYRQVLAGNPNLRVAQKGLEEAILQAALANEYRVGVQALAAENYDQAVALLSALAQKAPHYRDVERLLAQARAAPAATQHLEQAEAAWKAQQWVAAIESYETFRQLVTADEAGAVAPQLAIAYLRAGQQIVAGAVAGAAGDASKLSLAQSYFRRALALPVENAAAQQEDQLLSLYLAGARAFQNDDPAQAIANWEPLYAGRPAYLGGELVEQLYRAYLLAGDRAAERGDREDALAWYEKAAALPVTNRGEAQARTQTAAATATPLPPPAAHVAVAPTPVSTAPPTATPQPIPSPTPAGWTAYSGWIAFRSNRGGSEGLYLMRPDGSEQQPATAEVRAALDQLYARQQWSADETAQVFVGPVPDHAGFNLFLAYTAGVEAGQPPVRLTQRGGADYDPVWSPAGGRIAFASNHTGNDEVWVVDVESRALQQLTYNDWEWDKHPTWSPDGGQIAFFSNRTGPSQIWVMDGDGANQRNLSNNDYDDWDPVWIR